MKRSHCTVIVSSVIVLKSLRVAAIPNEVISGQAMSSLLEKQM